MYPPSLRKRRLRNWSGVLSITLIDPRAFFTIVRPWDRPESISRSVGYDIFAKIREEGLEGPDGSLIAWVRDLRRYLLLVEAEMTERRELRDVIRNADVWLSVERANF
jgi:hypothetical protein